MSATTPDKPLPTPAEVLAQKRATLRDTDKDLTDLQRNLTGPISMVTGQEVSANDVGSPLNQVFEMGSFTPVSVSGADTGEPGSYKNENDIPILGQGTESMLGMRQIRTGEGKNAIPIAKLREEQLKRKKAA